MSLWIMKTCTAHWSRSGLLQKTVKTNVIESPHNISFISYKSTESNGNGTEHRLPTETLPQNLDFLATCSQMEEIGAISPPNYMSTPISLQQFENLFETHVNFYSITDTLADDSEEGTNFSLALLYQQKCFKEILIILETNINSPR